MRDKKQMVEQDIASLLQWSELLSKQLIKIVSLSLIRTVELVESDSWVFRHPTKIYDPKVFLFIKLNLSIRTSCTIWHISLVPWCVALDRFHCTTLLFVRFHFFKYRQTLTCVHPFICFMTITQVCFDEISWNFNTA
jgi:hypothetical protein